jgi:hypothetical protein
MKAINMRGEARKRMKGCSGKPRFVDYANYGRDGLQKDRRSSMRLSSGVELFEDGRIEKK